MTDIEAQVLRNQYWLMKCILSPGARFSWEDYLKVCKQKTKALLYDAGKDVV